jgi:hypothetical protein
LLAKEIYCKAIEHFDELALPYASVISIDINKLPSVSDIKNWNSNKFVESLQNNRNNINFNSSFRQYIHISYKIAAAMGDDYLNAVKQNADIIGKNVTLNIYERHIKPLFYK